MEDLAKFAIRAYWETSGSQVRAEELDEPLVNGLLLNHKVYAVRTKEWGSLVGVVAVGYYDGYTFVLPGKVGAAPDNFNEMIIREKILVDEKAALNISKVYVIVESQAYKRSFLEKATDIPWSENAAGKNPSEYENIVKPHQVTPTSDGGFQVRLYTWGRTLGILIEWSFVISSDGQLSIQTVEVAQEVGDCIFPPI